MGRNRPKRRPGQYAQTALVIALTFGTHFLLSSDILSAQEEVLVDRLIAEVNGEPIAYSEVIDKVKNGPLIEVAPFPADEKDPPFEVALQDLINQKLITQKSVEYQIEVSEEAIDEELDKFLVRRNLTMDGLRQALIEQGISMEEYRKDFKSQMILAQFQGKVILPSVKITDKDVEIYFLRSSGNKAENVRLQLRQIFVEVDPKAKSTVRKSKEDIVQTVQEKLKNGMEFEEAAKVYSDDESGRSNGGMMPPINLRDMAPQFQAAIEPLSPGQVSEPVKTPQGYYIFFLQDKTFAESGDFERKKKELEYQLRQEEVGKQTIKWLSEQRDRSKIKILRDDIAGPTPPAPESEASSEKT